MRPAQCLLRGISASSVPALLKLRSGSSFTHSNMDSFEALARTFSAIEKVKNSRVVSIQLLASAYRQLLALPTSEVLTSALYLTASQLAPSYEGIELQFGTKSFVKCLKQLEVEQEGTSKTLEMLLATYSDYGQATQSLLDSGRIVIPKLGESETMLSIQAVHENLLAFAKDEGSGGVARKQQLALKLLKKCRFGTAFVTCSEERIFLVRMLAHQNLRIGLGEKSILSALAMASLPSTRVSTRQQDAVALLAYEKSWIDSVTQAYAQHPNYRILAKLLHASQHVEDIEQRIEWLHNEARPTTGVPVLTMSAYPVSSVVAVLDRISKSTSRTATCEYKYDGARVQVHLAFPDSSSSTYSIRRIFSRNMEDVTERFASLLDLLEKRLTARNLEAHDSTSGRSLIVEGEVVAVDRQTGMFRPFQVLQTKTTTEFCLYLFDLLAVDGINLLQEPLRKRRALLHDLFDEESGYVEFVKNVDINLASCDTLEDTTGGVEAETSHIALSVQNCLEMAVASGCEGLMVKALDDRESEYKAGRRSFSWMKLKYDYLTDQPATSIRKHAAASGSGNGIFLVDTLDLVPIGAFYGKGRRAGVFGSFLMATYNVKSGKYETIGKVGTGFSDVHLMEIAVRFQKEVLPATDEVPEQYQSYSIRSRHPDVWLSPSEVWEIKATQLTESSLYTCGAIDYSDRVAAAVAPQKGLALRFPRFVRYRPDKKPLEATDSEFVVKLYQQQRQQVPHVL